MSTSYERGLSHAEAQAIEAALFLLHERAKELIDRGPFSKPHHVNDLKQIARHIEALGGLMAEHLESMK